MRLSEDFLAPLAFFETRFFVAFFLPDFVTTFLAGFLVLVTTFLEGLTAVFFYFAGIANCNDLIKDTKAKLSRSTSKTQICIDAI